MVPPEEDECFPRIPDGGLKRNSTKAAECRLVEVSSLISGPLLLEVAFPALNVGSRVSVALVVSPLRSFRCLQPGHAACSPILPHSAGLSAPARISRIPRGVGSPQKGRILTWQRDHASPPYGGGGGQCGPGRRLEKGIEGWPRAANGAKVR